MTFKLYSRTSGEPLDTVEMHVLAKAYRAAWRSRYTDDPAGLHVIEALNLVIDFGGTGASVFPSLPDDSPFSPHRRKDWA
jgi:hypothetical protein